MMDNTTTRSTEETLRLMGELLDKQEIYECIARYCRGTDRHHRDLIAEQYHPEGVDDHGVRGERSGGDWADDVMKNDLTRTWVHHLGQVIIDLYGDEAFAETYWVAYQAWSEHGQRYLRTRGGRYADRFRRHEGRWKVLVRRVVDDWSKVEPVTAEIHDRSTHVGAVYPNDPIYVMQREIQHDLGRGTAEQPSRAIRELP